jgi:PilZ domain
MRRPAKKSPEPKERQKENRQYPRFQADIQVSVTVGDRKLPARTRDISRSGVCLISTEEIAHDANIDVELILAFAAGGVSEPLRLAGRTAWCTAMFGSYQVGLMFVNVGYEQARYLEMFMGLLDGTTDAEDPFDNDREDTDRRSDPDDPFRP